MAFRHGKPQRLRRDPSRWQSDEPRPSERWQNFTPRDRLHELRAQVHREFDPLWRSKTKRVFANRPAAYAWLAQVLGLDREAHVSEFDEATCERAVRAIRSVKP